MQFSPNLVVTVDSMIKALYTSNWQRVAREAADALRIIKVRPSTSRRELLTWIWDTMGIYPGGQGGNARFDDILATSYEIDNENWQGGLRLTTNELEDNQLEKQPNVGALDFAAKWARDRSAEEVWWPRQTLFGLIAAGGTALGYDGEPFFSSSHPILPGQSAAGNYSNIITGVGLSTIPNGTPPQGTYLDAMIINQINFAKALAKIRQVKFGTATRQISRFLVPRIVVAPTALEYTVNQLIGGGGQLTSGPAADVIAQTTNVFGRNYRFDKPIIAPELDALSSTTYYIGVEDLMSDEVGAFIYSERKPFELRGYPDASSVEANRSDIWEWLLKGRNVGAYGHPYLFYQCTT